MALERQMEHCDLLYIAEQYELIKNSTFTYALVHMNIKNFRFFNTKYGNSGGNEILSLVFCRLSQFLDEDEYVAHLYADNFAILVKCEDTDTLMYKRMVPDIDKLYRIDDERIYRQLFTSYGIYKIEDKSVGFHDALNLANLCRKECGSLNNRNFCMEVYEQGFYNRYMGQMELENKTADAYKNYEFISYLQPKVDLKTGEIAGAEALLRWIDKDGNLVPLYQFLPILTQNSYIIPVDLDIFDQTCKFLEQRYKRGKKSVPVSFNISKPYFYNPNILKDYVGVFEKYDIPKSLIQIEFMESISMNDTEHMKKVIAGFKDYGFICCLDDFGNGYSSFNVLLNATLDIIKMDRQFFLDNLNGDGRLVIKTMIDLIHSLKMKVVAEGVETEAHVNYLKECGCDYAQGYYYYKPMSREDFEELLNKSKGETGAFI